MLWFFFTIGLGIAAIFAAWPFLRTESKNLESGNGRTRLYQRQIDEIDKEESQGVISTPEAEALRIEAQRRLLAASHDNHLERQEQVPLSRTTTAFLITGMVIAGGVGLYIAKGRPTAPSSNRPPLLATLEAQTNTQEASQVAGSVDSMIDGLTARLNANPDDVEGWRMLGWSYFNLEQYSNAADAYERAVALAPNNSDFQSAYGESLVMASGGLVTNKALKVFQDVRILNPEDARSRFFVGLSMDQAGDSHGAISAWIDMINTAPTGADWVSGLRQRVVARAAETGFNIEGLVALAPDQPSSSPPPGPSAEQVKDAMEMPEDDRQTMVEGMVARLDARLKENPDDPDGWIQLIRSKMVLGRRAEAEQDLKLAINTFNKTPDTKARIIAEAEALGVRVR